MARTSRSGAVDLLAERLQRLQDVGNGLRLRIEQGVHLGQHSLLLFVQLFALGLQDKRLFP